MRELAGLTGGMVAESSVAQGAVVEAKQRETAIESPSESESQTSDGSHIIIP